MKKSTFKALLAAAAIFGSSLSALAVPAMPGIRSVTQADGSTIKAQLIGDENHSFWTSEDGYVLVKDNGIYYFAEIDEHDNLVPSQWRAVDIDSRSASLRSYLAGVDRDALTDIATAEWTARAEASQRHAAVMRAGTGLLPGRVFPAIGDRKILVILVEYQDVAFSMDNPQQYFHDLLNKPGFSENGGTGSVRDYFIDTSAGQFRPQIDVYGPVKLKNVREYYGGNANGGHSQRAGAMITEAISALDAKVDFSQYDTDNDGIIDNVFVYYAGQGEASGGPEESVWPHQGFISGSVDGKSLSTYGCTCELLGNKPDGIGTFVHEFSHVLGLPDLYATSYPTPAPFTPGAYDIMDQGPYNNNGNTPPFYSCYERYVIGWVNPIEIKGDMNCSLRPMTEANECYIVKTFRDAEYFILENRQMRSWDSHIPGHGMLVWHIDYQANAWTQNIVNNKPAHQYVDIIEADNVLTDGTREGDPFPGSEGVKQFTDDTTPSMCTWNGTRNNLPITDITESAPNGLITFKVGKGVKATATTAKAAANITPRSFKASWNKVSTAKSYRLSVYTKSGSDITYAPGFNNRSVGNATEFTVTGLEPSTAYIYSVVVEDGKGASDPSNEIAVNTSALTFEYVIPEALAATDIKDNSFTANWNAVDGATSYEIKAYRNVTWETKTISMSFDNKLCDWFTTSTSFYTNSLYASKIPSLKMTQDDYISTPYIVAPRSLSFWHRGQKTDDKSVIIVEGLVDDCWTPVAYYPVSTKTKGQTNKLALFPDNVTALRIYASGVPDAGAIYLDDISVVYGGYSLLQDVEGFAPMNVGNVTSVSVDKALSGSDNYYTITAINGSTRSIQSMPVYVRTTGATGIESVTVGASSLNVTTDGGMMSISGPEGSPLVVTDMMGRVAFSGSASNAPVSLNLPAGVYLVKCGLECVKVIVK